jgi:glycosyltransferase involved in cell wall biosynthesis
MVESLASGKPVIALGRGGATDIVGNGCGVLYAEPTEESLEDALRTFDRIQSLFEPAHLKASANMFSEAAFERRFRAALKGPSGDSAEKARSASGGKFANVIPYAVAPSILSEG